ncbi:MAG: hypothetical protein OEM62_00325, partial [Acidobacteriota bacterium]|nr:hypothetical protein [Acidobacteriota bacterium]
RKSHIAILGAGPTGLEAALAAVDFGFPFTLYEASSGVAGNVRSWGHVRLFSPWSFDISERMQRHLETAGHPAPGAEPDCPTGDELVERVLAPLAALPYVEPHLRTGTRVVEIGREGLLKHEEIGSGRRGASRFRLLLEDESGESIEHADVVLDCTGTYGNPNTLGDGGIAAPGERALADGIRRHIPDFLGEPEVWAGKTVLLVGAGHSAQTAATDLSDLAERYPGTRVLWALRRSQPEWAVDPDDPLPERARLVAEAEQLADGSSEFIETLKGVVVDSLARRSGKIEVTLRHQDGTLTRIAVDWVLSLTGSVGDHSIYRQLQVHECYATAGPMKLSAALLGSTTEDCLDQESHGVDNLVNPELNFFILGVKSYGRNAAFLMRVGWQQVEEVFELLAAAATNPSKSPA